MPSRQQQPSSAQPDSPPVDVDSAQDALAALGRGHLIRSWTVADTGFDILVGRGTVSIDPMDPASVLWLATTLRRDRITVVGKPYPMGSRTRRYNLSDGRFADHYSGRHDRFFPEYAYTVYMPGGDRSGSAKEQFGASTLREALALAGLDRIRGRCEDCETLRPLHAARTWCPDPAIPCPGCGAAFTVPAHLLCASCKEPIEPASLFSTPYPYAWHHSTAGSPRCAGTTDRPTYAHPL